MRPDILRPTLAFRLAALALAFTAAAAQAQDTPSGGSDPIGALLQGSPPATAPAAAAPIPTAPTAAPAAPPTTYAIPPYSPPVYSPPPSPPAAIAAAPAPRITRPPLTAPVHIDEVGKTPDGPPTERDQTYEARIRSSFRSAQGLQGPLDGLWTLSANGVGDLFALDLVDRSGAALEGAWRDLRRVGALGASGFVDDIQRYGGQLTLRFYPHGGTEPAVATLASSPDGRWFGELVDRGERRTVTLRRN